MARRQPANTNGGPEEIGDSATPADFARSKSGQLNIRLDESDQALLEHVRDRSDYIRTLLSERRAEWMESYSHLRAAGWAGNEICAAMDALNGTHIEMLRPGSWLAIELHDAERLNETATAKWDVDAERWDALVARVHDERTLDGWALRLLARAFWSGDEAVDKRIRS